MIILIAGGTHTGKTALAQRLLEKHKYPYLSIDHLKMGLIRSGYCPLTPESDDNELTAYLWPVVREIIKAAIENDQNLIVEGCCIPFDFKKDFSEKYLKQIQYICLILSQDYISNHFDKIKNFANVVETRLDDSYITRESMIDENTKNLDLCKKYSLNYVLVEDNYEVDFDAHFKNH